MASQGSLNKVMLIGNVGTEIKARYFHGGGAVANFTMATNEAYVDKNTNRKIVNTEWHNIVVRNKLAEIFEKYVKVGDKIYVEGRLTTRKWKDDKGLDRFITEINVSEFTFLNSAGRDEKGSAVKNESSKTSYPKNRENSPSGENNPESKA